MRGTNNPLSKVIPYSARARNLSFFFLQNATQSLGWPRGLGGAKMRISTLIDVVLCLFDFASSFTPNSLRLTGSFIKKASILSLLSFSF